MSDNNGGVHIDISLSWILTIVFIILKLCKVISWSWLWVFAPVWGTLAVALIAFIVYFVARLLQEKKGNTRE